MDKLSKSQIGKTKVKFLVLMICQLVVYIIFIISHNLIWIIYGSCCPIVQIPYLGFNTEAGLRSLTSMNTVLIGIQIINFYYFYYRFYRKTQKEKFPSFLFIIFIIYTIFEFLVEIYKVFNYNKPTITIVSGLSIGFYLWLCSIIIFLILERLFLVMKESSGKDTVLN